MGVVLSAAILSAGCETVPEPTPAPEPAPAPGPGWDQVGDAAPSPCWKSQQLPEFSPWPPPGPSDARLLTEDELGLDPASFRTLGEYSDFVAASLKRAGYESPRYFQVECGVVLMTRMERFDEQGRPFAGAARWAPEPSPFGSGSFTDLLKAQLFPVVGYYRVFLFVIAKPFTTNNPFPERDEMDRMLGEGVLWLDGEYAGMPLSADHKLVMLVYEFEKQNGAEASITNPTRLDAGMHLQGTGLAELWGMP